MNKKMNIKKKKSFSYINQAMNLVHKKNNKENNKIQQILSY